jgi:hypothetical protein
MVLSIFMQIVLAVQLYRHISPHHNLPLVENWTNILMQGTWMIGRLPTKKWLQGWKQVKKKICSDVSDINHFLGGVIALT